MGFFLLTPIKQTFNVKIIYDVDLFSKTQSIYWNVEGTGNIKLVGKSLELFKKFEKEFTELKHKELSN